MFVQNFQANAEGFVFFWANGRTFVRAAEGHDGFWSAACIQDVVIFCEGDKSGWTFAVSAGPKHDVVQEESFEEAAEGMLGWRRKTRWNSSEWAIWRNLSRSPCLSLGIHPLVRWEKHVVVLSTSLC